MRITAVGGYEEVGRNMTAIKIGGDTIIVEMGIRLDRVMVHEDTDISKMGKSELASKGIIPDDSVVRGDVKAIILTHGHLDHIGAVTILAKKYKNAPIIGTRFTTELIKKEQNFGRLKNPVHTLDTGDILQITPEIGIEFVRMTHSIPHTAMLVVHTKEGKLVYANDFKLDDTPVIGEPPDYRRIKELGSEGIKCMIVETTRVLDGGRTPSEKIAEILVRDNLKKSDPEKGLIVTTFSSQIARIKSITEAASAIGRTPVLLGRSMEKYVGLAEKTEILNLPEDAHLYGAPDAIRKSLKTISDDGREKYLLIVTGHQGEPDALLSKISLRKLAYKIKKDDQVIFSATVIPNPINVANRYSLETKLRLQGARIFKDVHVSGHAYREDHSDLLKMLQPEKIIPCHGDLTMLTSYIELAEDHGYQFNRDIFLLRNGQSVTT